ncbi:oxoglutarate/iron-dependent dioxygenase [Artemisia annua]|uniref:Oxoglutarate/iron-dependent dioxygenase n=1 Tax=Artemisia annua TaxID=35608 RepID=A0A2U1N8H4_ARTAN|nr:oxoglutarate/iron-dependent dioxygenase [Artemisia annua]
MGFLAQPKIPVINMVDLKQNTTFGVSACDEVRHALEEYGCFLVDCNGITEGFSSEVLDALQNLFDLPIETKVKNISDKAYHGYVGQIPFLPLLESMGIENATSVHGVNSFTTTMWPSGNDNFCNMIHSYARFVSEIEETVRKMVFRSFGVEKYHQSYNDSVTYLLRVMKYRPPSANETKLGSISHTDKSFISILTQNQVKGLEVKTKDNKWIPVEYPPCSFLVMAGDAFKAWSNDRVHSPYHRVVMEGGEYRYSIGVFTYHKGIVTVPEELVDNDHLRKFKSFDHFGYLDFYDKDSLFEQEFSHIKSYCGV